MVLCKIKEVKAKNTVSLQRLKSFFNVYDKLNNPVYLRQINLLVDEIIVKHMHIRIEILGTFLV